MLPHSPVNFSLGPNGAGLSKPGRCLDNGQARIGPSLNSGVAIRLLRFELIDLLLDAVGLLVVLQLESLGFLILEPLNLTVLSWLHDISDVSRLKGQVRLTVSFCLLLRLKR